MGHTQIRLTSPARVTERARKSGLKNGTALWIEAMEQHRIGWLSLDSRLTTEGGPSPPRPIAKSSHPPRGRTSWQT